jgi:hypothetical protein
LSSTRAISLTAGVGRTEADEDAYAYYAFLLSPALALELPRGWSLGLALHAQVLRFDAEDPLFGRTRHDRLMQAQVAVHRRDWHLLGFSPRLALLYTRRDSNLALYDFRRMQFLFGFTREF